MYLSVLLCTLDRSENGAVMSPEQEQAAVFFVVMSCAYGAILGLKLLAKTISQIIREIRRIHNGTRRRS